MTVALVGAGPGDPGLITVRGLELLRACDAVVYDRLVAPELVDETPADALRIPRDGALAEADRRPPRRARPTGARGRPPEGRRPLRLRARRRGGARAGRGGIPFEVVPGISSIAAVPAAAGIPVTHRGVADRVTIATAHAADGSPPDYASLVAAAGRSSSSWGSGGCRELADGLIRAGMAAATPAAVVSRGRS